MRQALDGGRAKLNVQRLLAFLAALATIGGAVSVVVGSVRSGLGLVRGLPWGRRRRLAKQLALLRTGQTLNAFERRLGPPEALVRDSAGRKFVFEHRVAAVVALVDDDDVVTAYAVSMRDKRFRPTIRLNARGSVPHLVVRLGVTTFFEFGEPDEIEGWLGAQSYEYRERHYIGRPGGYHHFFVCHDFGSPVGTPAELITLLHEGPVRESDPTHALADPSLSKARSATPITRYGVTSPFDSTGWMQL